MNECEEHQRELPASATHPIESQVDYGTMRQRFAAYVADLPVIYLILISAYFVSGLIGKNLPAGELEAQGIFLLALFTYMTTCQVVYHTTVGKYIIGLEVVRANAQSQYPSFWRVLLRETIGRILASLFFGLGYWFAVKDPCKQAWSDQIAGTVVIARRTHTPLRRGLIALVVLAFIVDLGVILWGQHLEDRTRRYQAASKEVQSISTELQSENKTIIQIIERTPRDIGQWQASMQELLGHLDRYDGLIERMQGLIQRVLNENLSASQGEVEQLKLLQQVYRLRKEQSAKWREEANLILRWDASTNSPSTLESKLKLLDADIASLDQQASRLVAQIDVR